MSLEELKEIIFTSTKREKEAYLSMKDDCYIDFEEKETQRQRFCALWDVVEDAELVDEYESWQEEQD